MLYMLRYISILVCITILCIESLSHTVSALMESDLALHSLDELSVLPVTSGDISSLLSERAQYIKNETNQLRDTNFIADPFRTDRFSLEPLPTDILMADREAALDPFMTTVSGSLMSGIPASRIRVPARIHRESHVR
jgi:hypothetical protein